MTTSSYVGAHAEDVRDELVEEDAGTARVDPPAAPDADLARRMRPN